MTFRSNLVRAACMIGGLTALPFGTVLAAQTPSMAVSLESAVYVEKGGSTARTLQPASRLSPGDRVVTILTWHKSGPGNRFTLTNPLPRSVYYQGSAREDEEVSIDGGHTWGQLGSLRVADRLATPEDVTHVRWRISAVAPSGQIAYSAIVR
ncbi:MAG: hypothetical protein ABI673_08250 [Novosphingobium sp.]